MTFVTLECVRARVWLLPSLRSVGACVWPWLPERVVVVHIPCTCNMRTCLRAPFSPPSTASDPRPVGGNFGGSDPNSTRGIRKNGFDHLEILQSAGLHPIFSFWTLAPP